MPKAKGLNWLGTRTERYEEMIQFLQEVLGLELQHKGEDFAILALEDGTHVEVFGPGEKDHPFMTTGPVVGFRVDDVHSARKEMEAAGIEFLDPEVQSFKGSSWTHFRGPDGSVYQLADD
jgi:catechol 2,3-dioxygenase-like lactoylglutathione lyase family enzyme